MTENPEGAAALLKPIEARTILGIAKSTFCEWVRAGVIDPVMRTKGGHGRFSEAEVRNLLARLRAAANRSGHSPQAVTA